MYETGLWVFLIGSIVITTIVLASLWCLWKRRKNRSKYLTPQSYDDTLDQISVDEITPDNWTSIERNNNQNREKQLNPLSEEVHHDPTIVTEI